MQIFLLFAFVVGAIASQECPSNSHFTSCGTSCPLTCDNYSNPPKVCVLMCKIGCACDAGYVETGDGRCVLPEDCPAKAQEKNCVDDADAGKCNAYFSKWYYNRHTGYCRPFVFGGCDGNGNRYESEEECYKHCGSQKALDRPDCDKKGETGPCMALFERYYYDQEEGMCKKFIYGGCGGNRNNFKTEFDCYNKCGAL